VVSLRSCPRVSLGGNRRPHFLQTQGKVDKVDARAERSRAMPGSCIITVPSAGEMILVGTSNTIANHWSCYLRAKEGPRMRLGRRSEVHAGRLYVGAKRRNDAGKPQLSEVRRCDWCGRSSPVRRGQPCISFAKLIVACLRNPYEAHSLGILSCWSKEVLCIVWFLQNSRTGTIVWTVWASCEDESQPSELFSYS
jgi:hypothetical protein